MHILFLMSFVNRPYCSDFGAIWPGRAGVEFGCKVRTLSCPMTMATYILGYLVILQIGFSTTKQVIQISVSKFYHILSTNTFLFNPKVQICKGDTAFQLYFENVQY